MLAAVGGGARQRFGPRAAGLTLACTLAGAFAGGACGNDTGPGPGSGPAPPQDDGSAPSCSQVHRELARWQGETRESAECGPDLTGLLELTPVGDDRLLVRRPFSSPDDLWQLTPDGALGAGPVEVLRTGAANIAAFTLLPGPEPRVLAYAPHLASWTLYHVRASVVPQDPVLVAAESASWGTAYWKSVNGAPIGHQFIGLEGGYLLDRDLGDGSARVWRFVSGANGNSQLRAPGSLVAPPRDSFRRGHRLVHLGPGRLLEWIPSPCQPSGATAAGCGAAFAVWRYSLDDSDSAGPGIAFEAEPASSGVWPEIDAGHDILADDVHLFVWKRASGELRSYPLRPETPDPLSGPAVSSAPDERLRSADWTPPTQAPALKHLLLVVQDGRSFDSYFGRYCAGEATADGAPPACEEGAGCCERMPASIPGAASCAPLGSPSDAYHPDDRPECLRAKINGGAMDGFATAPAAGGCGDPNDFACAGPGPEAGAVAAYHRLAARGALADRYFQSYAFLAGDGAPPRAAPNVANFLYLVTTRFPGDFTELFDTPLITAELARLQVPWAIYAGRKNLAAMTLFGIAFFYDPDWSPYRSLEGRELELDIAMGQLPAVSVVLPDFDDPARSEAPGNAVGPGIGYVERLVQAIDDSPYRDDTLILVAHLTAGGYYDHVAPPPPLALDVDASSGLPAEARAVHYGPRVPLLALGRFARRDHIAHVPMEMSSIARFIEWNWLRGSSLKGLREVADRRRYRDTVVNNLGSLLDAAQTGVTVPAGD